MATNWTPIAVTDECTTCGFCGREGLKKTVVFESEVGDFLYLGSDCAAKLAARQGKKDPKAYAAARIARTLSAAKSAIAIAQEDLDKAFAAQAAGQRHPQGIQWEQSIAIRTANLNAVKEQFGIAIPAAQA